MALEREKIRIENFEIEIVRRPRARRLSLKVQTSGEMRLTAAVGTPDKYIRGFLLDQLAWIKKTSQKFEKVREAHPEKQYSAGDQFCFLGEHFKLQFTQGERVSLNVDRTKHEMMMTVPDLSIAPTIAKTYLRDFYSQVGRKYISGRISAISGQMKLEPSAISFRSQKTRWGSCSSKGRVTFNWRLAIAPPAVIDYVIIHELAHLKHMDHSLKFWNLVEKYSPDHKKLKRWLNKNRYESDFLAEKSELHIGPEDDNDLD